MIKKIPLEEILKLESLKSKEYLVREIDHDVNDNLLTAVLQCKGLDGEIIYISSQRFSRIDEEESSEICLDKEGLPYFEKSFGPIKYKIYEKIFLTNTGFGAAMAGLNQELLLEILRKVKEENHPVYKEFRSYIDRLIKEAPKIKEAKDKKHYFNDKSDLKNYSELDLEIFEYLAAKEHIISFRKGYDSDNYDVSNIKLSQTQKVNFREGRTKEEACFMTWYRNCISSKGYKKKIENPWRKESWALEEWIDKVSENLELNGFRRVEQFSYQ